MPFLKLFMYLLAMTSLTLNYEHITIVNTGLADSLFDLQPIELRMTNNHLVV